MDLYIGDLFFGSSQGSGYGLGFRSCCNMTTLSEVCKPKCREQSLGSKWPQVAVCVKFRPESIPKPQTHPKP